MGHSMAVVCLGGDRTELAAQEVPEPGPGELLLGLRVVGFCGTDLFKLTTGAAVPGGVLGHELVGEVVARGSDVPDFAIGDRVAVPHHVPCGVCALCLRGNETMCETFRENLLFPGAFSDHILVKPRATSAAAWRLPDDVSDDAAVFLEPAACVLRGVDRAQLPERGAVAVVLGGGSMGLLHLLVLRARDPQMRVVVVDPVAERQDLARTLGAAAAAAPGDAASEAVLAVSDGLGADAVFDTVGGAGPLRDGLALTRQGGAVVLFAHAGPDEAADFNLNDLFKYERRVVGSYSGALVEQRGIFEMIADGRLDPTPLISHRMPLERFAEGMDLARRRQALKILFTPTGSGGAS